MIVTVAEPAGGMIVAMTKHTDDANFIVTEHAIDINIIVTEPAGGVIDINGYENK